MLLSLGNRTKRHILFHSLKGFEGMIVVWTIGKNIYQNNRY